MKITLGYPSNHQQQLFNKGIILKMYAKFDFFKRKSTANY